MTGYATTAWFEWGTSTVYGNTTTTWSTGSGSSTALISEVISGLTPDTTYHFQIIAENVNGTSYSGDKSFVARDPLIDFISTALDAPTEASLGTYIDVSSTVLNQGRNASASYSVGVYLSDSVIRDGDYWDRLAEKCGVLNQKGSCSIISLGKSIAVVCSNSQWLLD